MDHMMPVMDGIETVKHIRALAPRISYCKNVPIVAMTANAITGAKEMFMENGFNDFLSKPIDTIKLNAVLEIWIPREKQQKSSSYESSIIKPVTKPHTDLNIEIAGVDIKQGMSMCGGTVENYKRMLGIFQRDGIKKTEEIKKCLATDNLPLYVTYVHALKSAAANIGAGELSDMAGALETAGNQKDLTFIQTHNAKLLSTLETLLESINKTIQSDKQEGHQGSVDMNLLRAELAKLTEAIDTVNPDAINAAVDNLQPFIQAADVGSNIENILKKTLVGEYDEAVATIKKLLT
jgi:CheY-like chemotaxis protein